MPEPEKSSFELPPEPPVFDVSDESPDPADVPKITELTKTEPSSPIPSPEPQPKPQVPEPIPQPPPTPKPPEPVPVPASGTPPTPEPIPALAAAAKTATPDAPPTPESLAASVHAERTSQEKLIADFAGAPVVSPSETIKKGIELIREIRQSLERQAAIVEKTGRSSPARLQQTQLGILLRGIANVRDRGKPMVPAELVDSLHSIFNLESLSDRPVTEIVPSASAGAPPAPEAPKAPAETVNIIASPDAGVSQEILADPVHFDVGKAMDVAGFSEFLAEAEASGTKIDMANEAGVRRYFEVFASKDALAGKVAELCAKKILGERGIELGDEGVTAVKAYLERQAHLRPEALKELAQKFERFEKLSADAVALTADVAKFQTAIPVEAERKQNIQEVLAANKKLEVLEMARKTNKFWGGAGWTHHIWGLFGSKYSTERVAARQEAARMGMGHSSVLVDVASFGNTLSSGKMRAGIAAIEKDLAARVDAMKGHQNDAKSLAFIERKKREAETLIASERQRIVFDKGLTDTLVGIANKKLIEQLNALKAPNADVTVEAAQEVFGLVERAEAAYKKSPSGNKHLEGIDPTKDMTAIEAVIEGSIWKEIETAFGEAATMPAGRFSRLETVLEGFAAKERLGKKDKQKIREFIIKRLTVALAELEKDRKILEAKPKGDEKAETEKKKKLSEFSQRAILIQTLIAKQRQKLASERATARPPSPPTPPSAPSAPPSAPPSPPSAPSREGGERSDLKSGERSDLEEPPERIVVEDTPVTESVGEVPIRTAEPKPSVEVPPAPSSVETAPVSEPPPMPKEKPQEASEMGESTPLGEGKIEQQETLSTAEEIGEVFVKFCRGKTEFPISQFLQELIKEVPNATVEEIYRSSGAQSWDIYFTKNREASPQRYWLVTVGAQKFVLPRPSRTNSFDDGNEPQGFSGMTEDLSPDSLTKILPAEVVEVGQRIEVKTPGWFNKPPQAETI